MNRSSPVTAPGEILELFKGGYLSVAEAIDALEKALRSVAQAPMDQRDKIYYIIAARFQNDPRETGFMYETVDLVLAALCSVPSTQRNSTPWDAHHNRSYEPVETRAKEIYDFFEYKETGTKPAWVPGGNSLMQDEARICARRQLREAGHASVVTRPQRGSGG